jgi:hypothetical protein
VEGVEGAEGSISPLGAAAMVTEDGRNRQATAAAIQSPENSTGKGESE